MYCIGYTDTLTMSVPLQCLPSLAADFDGVSIFYYYFNGSNKRNKNIAVVKPL